MNAWVLLVFSEAVEALQTFLTAAKETSVLTECRANEVLAQFKTKDYEIGITKLVGYA